MANPVKGLGKGLDILLGNDFSLTPEEKDSLELPISQIESSITQPRKYFAADALADLADSIREHGIIQPLTVRKLQSGYYQIIAGERRWRAARMAGLTKVPALVIEADDRKAMELALIENLQREDLNPIEEADGYRHLIDQYNLTQEVVAQRVGKSRSTITNSLRLLNLCDEVRDMLVSGTLSTGHARTLITLPAATQKSVAKQIIEKDLSVRQTELLLKKISEEKKEKKKDAELTVNYVEEAAKDLSSSMNRPCKIINGRKGGKIVLSYYGMDDLNDLLDALHKLK